MGEGSKSKSKVWVEYYGVEIEASASADCKERLGDFPSTAVSYKLVLS